MSRIVWSSETGDNRKKKEKENDKMPVVETQVKLNLRRLTAGKGRTVIEISGLPQNKLWCESLAKELKKSMGVGGSYKNNIIEIHVDKLERVSNFLDGKKIHWKKTGG
jgi:translation initiation factor 1